MFFKKIFLCLMSTSLLFASAILAFATEDTVFDDLNFLYSHEEILNEETKSYLENATEILENNETSQKQKEDIANVIKTYCRGIENCLQGNHNWIVRSEPVSPPMCVSVGTCSYCTEEKLFIEDSADVIHTDHTGDNVCDLCERKMLSVNCDHFCHNKNVIIQKLILPLIKLIWSIMNTQEFCECGMPH